MKSLHFIFFTLFLIFSQNLYGAELSKGQYVSGTLRNLYNQNINITLPVGNWEVLESVRDGEYQSIELYSSEYETWAYVYVPIVATLGDFWSGSGLKKCSGKDVFLSLVERGDPEATLCFEDQEIDGFKYGVVSLEVRNNNRPLKWMSMSFYTPIEKIKTSISEDQFKKIGKTVLKGFRDGFSGRNSSGIAELSRFFLSNSSETIVQDFESNYESNYSSNADKGVKEKLRELKNMLNEGLISQDQYDLKSSEILDDL